MSAEAEASAEQRKKRPAAKQPGTAIILCEYDGLGRVVKETVNTLPETVLHYEYDARGNVIKFTDAAGTIFERTYTKTDLLSEEKIYITEGDSETLKETRKYTYDEAGALKSVTEGTNTVYYNGADTTSGYQPDAYGNTRKEKWSKTGFELSYDYDSLNRLTSVTTPDNKTETYTYNKNSQITALSGIIGGTVSYKDTRLETVTLNDGLKKTLSYNEAGLISGISYDSKKNASLKTGFEYLYDKNFNITERTHKDTQKKDTFSYDGLNRLVTSNLKGRFTKDTYEQFDMYRMNEIDRDIDGMASEQNATLNGQFFPAYKVTLDEKGKSFVYDFAEDGWEELSPDSWNYEVYARNQSIHFNLKETLKTRFIKIRTIWDDRVIEVNGSGKCGIETCEGSELTCGSDISVQGFEAGMRNEGAIKTETLKIKTNGTRGYVCGTGSRSKFGQTQIEGGEIGIHCTGNAEAEFEKGRVKALRYGIKSDRDEKGSLSIKLDEGSVIEGAAVLWYDWEGRVLTDEKIEEKLGTAE